MISNPLLSLSSSSNNISTNPLPLNLSKVMSLKVEVAKLSALSEGSKRRQAEVETKLKAAASGKADALLKSEEAQEECEKLAGDLKRAKEELEQSEEEKRHLQDRLEAIPPFDPNAGGNGGCCTLM